MLEKNIPLILGSSSLGRQRLLKQAVDVPFTTVSPDVDETLLPREKAEQAVLRLAKAKMVSCRLKRQDAFLITADTLALCGGKTLEKTTDLLQGRQHLTCISGRKHTMVTAVCVSNPLGEVRHRLVKTKVHFKCLSVEEVDAYLATDEWKNTSGGYTIEGKAERFILSIHGSYSNILGLPIYQTLNLLKGLGFIG